MHPTSWLEIKVDRLRQNVAWWRHLLESQAHANGTHPARLGAVVKANAYGLGAAPVARLLEGAAMGADGAGGADEMDDAGDGGLGAEGKWGGCDVDVMLVYAPAEAVELLEAGVTRPILIFLPTRELDAPLLREAAGRGQVEFSLDALDQLEALDKLGRSLAKPIGVHLHVDTGMSRAGLPADVAGTVLDALPKHAGVRLTGIYSHLATASTDAAFITEQNQRLDAFLGQHRAAIATVGGEHVCRHISSTYSACRHVASLRHLVRVGLGLFGYGPELLTAPLLSKEPPPRPVLRWVSRIAHVQTYPTGATVSYERSFKLARDSRLGVVPAGYGVGYPWALGNKSCVRVLDREGCAAGDAPLRGQVNMDQIVIDLTTLPAGIGVGSDVELISSDPTAACALPALASLAGSTCYEMLCRLSPRLPRRYV